MKTTSLWASSQEIWRVACLNVSAEVAQLRLLWHSLLRTSRSLIDTDIAHATHVLRCPVQLRASSPELTAQMELVRPCKFSALLNFHLLAFQCVLMLRQAMLDLLGVGTTDASGMGAHGGCTVHTMLLVFLGDVMNKRRHCTLICAQLLEWDAFDVFAVSRLSRRRPLQTVTWALLQHFGLVDSFSIPSDKLHRFLKVFSSACRHLLAQPACASSDPVRRCQTALGSCLGSRCCGLVKCLPLALSSGSGGWLQPEPLPQQHPCSRCNSERGRDPGIRRAHQPAQSVGGAGNAACGMRARFETPR